MMSLDFSQSIRRSYNVNKSGGSHLSAATFWVLCQVLGFNIIDLDNT